jgi:hypothetical protein
MRAAALLVVVALSAGCSHVQYALSGGAPVAATTGTSVTSGAAGLTVSSSSGAAVIFLLTLGAIEYARNPQPFPSPSSLFSPTPPAPELAANRRISEQDCSKPVDLSLGNLRCK